MCRPRGPRSLVLQCECARHDGRRSPRRLFASFRKYPQHHLADDPAGSAGFDRRDCRGLVHAAAPDRGQCDKRRGDLQRTGRKAVQDHPRLLQRECRQQGPQERRDENVRRPHRRRHGHSGAGHDDSGSQRPAREARHRDQSLQPVSVSQSQGSPARSVPARSVGIPEQESASHVQQIRAARRQECRACRRCRRPDGAELRHLPQHVSGLAEEGLETRRRARRSGSDLDDRYAARAWRRPEHADHHRRRLCSGSCCSSLRSWSRAA